MTIPFPFPTDANRQTSFATPLRLLLATTAALWMGAAQPQVPTATASRNASELRFRNFLRAPEDGGVAVSDTLREAEGQIVRLVGYMVQQDQATPGRFLLANVLTAPGTAVDATGAARPTTVEVLLEASQQDWTVPHLSGLVTVRGRLSLCNDQAQANQNSRMQLRLDSKAPRSTSAFELNGYVHKKQIGKSNGKRLSMTYWT